MRLISDTTCHLSQDEAEASGIILLPNLIEINGHSYRDYLDIDARTFIEELRTHPATTSQPAIGDVMAAYEATAPEATLHLTTGEGLSSAYESANGIKSQTNSMHVTVFSSTSVAGVNRTLMRLAIKLREEGASLQTIVQRLSACLAETQSYVIPADFSYLSRSGRLTPLAATLGGYLGIKPILAQSADRRWIERFGLARSWLGAIDAIVRDLVTRKVDGRHRLILAHAQNLEPVTLAKERILSRIPDADIEILELAPSMITHGGPDCLVIQYLLKDPLIRI